MNAVELSNAAEIAYLKLELAEETAKHKLTISQLDWGMEQIADLKRQLAEAIADATSIAETNLHAAAAIDGYRFAAGVLRDEIAELRRQVKEADESRIYVADIADKRNTRICELLEEIIGVRGQRDAAEAREERLREALTGARSWIVNAEKMGGMFAGTRMVSHIDAALGIENKDAAA